MQSGMYFSLYIKEGEFLVKVSLILCSMVAGFMLPLQAYSVRNRLAVKNVNLSNFVYYFGTDGSITQPGTQVVEPGDTWSEAICQPGWTASFTAKIPTKNGPIIFQVTDLIYTDVVVFFNDNGTITYAVNP